MRNSGRSGPTPIRLGSQTLARLDYDDFRAHPAWIDPAERLGGSEDGELHLISHQAKGRLHSQLETGAASFSNRRGGREKVLPHPADATPREIRDGDTVRLWNKRGTCLATAKLESSLRQVAIDLAHPGRPYGLHNDAVPMCVTRVTGDGQEYGARPRRQVQA